MEPKETFSTPPKRQVGSSNLPGPTRSREPPFFRPVRMNEIHDARRRATRGSIASRDQVLAGAQFSDRFQREAQAIAVLNHAHPHFSARGRFLPAGACIPAKRNAAVRLELPVAFEICLVSLYPDPTFLARAIPFRRNSVPPAKQTIV